MPAASEETVLKTMVREEICLEVVAPVAADPCPAVQNVEAAIGPGERICIARCHGP